MKQKLLTDKEIRVVEMLRNENFESLKVLKRNGKIDIIEGIEKIKDTKKIVDLLKQYEFQNLEIKQNDGRIVHINRTVREKQ
ncbi:hypothetical protein [Aquimarina agarilytica]|uniref:hypothetical protein n=1 Tax=Aquimarina agarilytica TaxID=1087449 RepID=UPI000288D8C0|nr:hypothetical protein [Aquimarina agarilytica]